jgi:hypothetical protein
MRRDDRQPDSMFSYVSAEQRVPPNHPLRAIRSLVDDVLRDRTRRSGIVGESGEPPRNRTENPQIKSYRFTVRQCPSASLCSNFIGRSVCWRPLRSAGFQRLGFHLGFQNPQPAQATGFAGRLRGVSIPPPSCSSRPSPSPHCPLASSTIRLSKASRHSSSGIARWPERTAAHALTARSDPTPRCRGWAVPPLY